MVKRTTTLRDQTPNKREPSDIMDQKNLLKKLSVVGKRTKELRLRAGLKKPVLAEMIGVPLDTLSLLENGDLAAADKLPLATVMRLPETLERFPIMLGRIRRR